MQLPSHLWSSFLQRLTFKRFVVLFLLFLLTIVVVRGFFPAQDKSTSPASSDEYEYKFTDGNKDSDNKILEVPLQGMILTEAADITNPLDVFQGQAVTYGYSLKDTFKRAAKDPSIKAILLQVNSPGGTVTGSEAISEGIEYYREKTGNPVFAHISDEGASGAYWASVVANKVYADNGSIVGSIGVLMGPFKYYDKVTQEGSVLSNVTTENGIETTYFTAGQYKDTGSPYRKMTQEEKDHWQNSLNDEYAVFVSHVSHYRHLPQDTIINTIKALPYDTKRAKELGLIDVVGSEDKAIADLAKTAHISDYQLISEKHKGGVIEQLFGAISHAATPQAKATCLICGKPLFLYDSTYSFFPQ